MMNIPEVVLPRHDASLDAPYQILRQVPYQIVFALYHIHV